ncbi:hypothetical protein, unlikely [Trypanosoma brucei gambiense DAL972]|uniref:Uncharacterized protein n=1 Tax=Trypanosoma brucei gambiense (strain MHOM/CI/86/DAL972) TaxID=679716 RepID=D0A0J4_TRYB9|nr:hypothetical protein, unlikely [Trypanosoma brucei gambiense DAL972]CBH16752.1 hypothetical protein, unlikely [Trypanosoma brucei gambiense DAL972]|eukprot:XP_011779016.1 hypothetical protein, unlikely [Trypanosoma brucei gambiense DAL972]
MGPNRERRNERSSQKIVVDFYIDVQGMSFTQANKVIYISILSLPVGYFEGSSPSNAGSLILSAFFLGFFLILRLLHAPTNVSVWPPRNENTIIITIIITTLHDQVVKLK